MIVRTLPTCAPRNPACGACGGETSHDGDSFYCEACGLDYGHGDKWESATYRDEDATPCGDACITWWHRPNVVKRGRSYVCAPCPLPAGHTSGHWRPCVQVATQPSGDQP